MVVDGVSFSTNFLGSCANSPASNFEWAEGKTAPTTCEEENRFFAPSSFTIQAWMNWGQLTNTLPPCPTIRWRRITDIDI